MKLLSLVHCVAILSFGLLILGCGKSEDEPTPQKDFSISLSKSSLSFVSAGGAEEVTVNSNDDWSMSGGDSWCTASAKSGKAGQSVTFTATANTSTDQTRTTSFTFKCGDKSATLSVTQAKAEGGGGGGGDPSTQFKEPSSDDVINPNVIVVDYDKLTLNSIDTTAKTASFTFAGTVPDFYEGAIIVLMDDKLSYPCYVLSSSVNGSQVDISYRNAGINEIFFNQKIVLSTSDDSYFKSREATKAGGMQFYLPVSRTKGSDNAFEFTNQMEFKPIDELKFTLEEKATLSGEIILELGEPETHKESKNAMSSIKRIGAVLKGALSEELKMELVYGGSITKDFKKILKKEAYVNTSFFFISGVPVTISWVADICAEASLEIKAELTFEAISKATVNVVAGADYVDGQGVKPINEITIDYKETKPHYKSAIGTVTLKGSIYPKLAAFIYFMAGVEVDLVPYGQLQFKCGNLEGKNFWNLELAAGMEFDAAVVIQPLGGDRFDIYRTDRHQIFEKPLWSAPSKVENKDSTKVAYLMPGVCENFTHLVYEKSEVPNLLMLSENGMSVEYEVVTGSGSSPVSTKASAGKGKQYATADKSGEVVVPFEILTTDKDVKLQTRVLDGDFKVVDQVEVVPITWIENYRIDVSMPDGIYEFVSVGDSGRIVREDLYMPDSKTKLIYHADGDYTWSSTYVYDAEPGTPNPIRVRLEGCNAPYTVMMQTIPNLMQSWCGLYEQGKTDMCFRQSVYDGLNCMTVFDGSESFTYWLNVPFQSITSDGNITTSNLVIEDSFPEGHFAHTDL